MAKQIINIGAAPSDNTGESLRSGGTKINANFTEVYDAVALNTNKVTNATHSGDATGSTALTFATVNANVGSFTKANITVNAKGLVTAASNGSSYLVYTALLTQTGTDAPVATVLENTLGNIVWSRSPNKTLFATFPTPVNINKLFINNGTIYLGSYTIGHTLYDFSGTPQGQVMIYADSPVALLTPGIGIDIYNSSDVQVDLSTMVSHFPIEIRVYP